MYRDDLNKISFILNSHDDYESPRSAFPDLHVGIWGMGGIPELCGEFGQKGISKATAIDMVMNLHGIGKEATIAFGNDESDASMLEYCGTGVAMGERQINTQGAC